MTAQTTPDVSHVDRLTLDLLAVGDLEADRAVPVEAHLDHCPACRERLWRIRKDLSMARRRMPERLPVEAFRRRERAERRSPGPWIAAAAGWAAAACGLLVWSPWRSAPADIGDATVAADAGVSVRARGSFGLSVLRGRGDGVERIGAVAVCRPGDRLQFEPDLPADGWFHVVDVQDDGQAQAWLPATPVGEVALDHSFELDDYAGAERVYFVLADRPLDAAELEVPIRDALAVRPIEEVDRLPLPDGVSAEQRSLLIYKGEVPR